MKKRALVYCTMGGNLLADQGVGMQSLLWVCILGRCQQPPDGTAIPILHWSFRKGSSKSAETLLDKQLSRSVFIKPLILLLLHGLGWPSSISVLSVVGCALLCVPVKVASSPQSCPALRDQTGLLVPAEEMGVRGWVKHVLVSDALLPSMVDPCFGFIAQQWTLTAKLRFDFQNSTCSKPTVNAELFEDQIIWIT